MKGKRLLRISTVFLVVVSMLVMNIPMVFAAAYAPTVVVTNNPEGSKDVVVVQGTTTSAVYQNDIVKVYKAASASATTGTLVGQGTATTRVGTSNKTYKAIINNIFQLGSDAGFVFVTVQRANPSNGSNQTTAGTNKAYVKEAVSTKTAAPVANTIKVTNNKIGVADTVVVNAGTSYNDAVVKVYPSSTSRTVLGRATVSSGSATVSLSQLGVKAGSVYVTLTQSGKAESARIAKAYEAEASKAITSANIKIYNLAGSTDDYVTITGTTTSAVYGDDVIKIYRGASGGSAIATGTAVGSSAADKTATVSIDIPSPGLGAKAGALYFTITRNDSDVQRAESPRLRIAYTAETTSSVLQSKQINITNNPAGSNDAMVVKTGVNSVTGAVYSAVYADCVIKVYDELNGGNPIATGTATGLAASTGEASFDIDDGALDDAGGTVYVSITRPKELESNRVAFKYKAIATPAAPASDRFTVTNNPEGTADTIDITSTSSGDVVKIYGSSLSTDNTILGMVKATGASAQVVIDQLPAVSVTGAVYATITEYNSIESARVAVSYDAEAGGTYISDVSSQVTVSDVDNTDGSTFDTIAITGLSQYDVVKVYDAPTGGNVLGGETVGSGGSVTINLLLPSSGPVYISVTRLGRVEGARVSKSY